MIMDDYFSRQNNYKHIPYRNSNSTILYSNTNSNNPHRHHFPLNTPSIHPTKATSYNTNYGTNSHYSTSYSSTTPRHFKQHESKHTSGYSKYSNHNYDRRKHKRWSSTSSSSSSASHSNKKHKKKKFHAPRIIERSKLQQAIEIERRVNTSLENLRSRIASASVSSSSSSSSSYFVSTKDPTSASSTETQTKSIPPAPLILFPTTRECNSAMAVFGDNNEFLRALRLFGKMRKSVNLAKKQQLANTRREEQPKVFMQYPAPTLVTYSTLMSRAVQLGKPQVALRLWRLMTIQSNYFSTFALLQRKEQKQELQNKIGGKEFMVQPPIIPDVRAVNILMNAYAKLADVGSCQIILQKMLQKECANDMKYDSINSSTPVNINHEDDHHNNMENDDNNQTKNTHHQMLAHSIPSMLKPNIVTWNTMMDACQRAGDLEIALQIRSDMREMGILPDIRTYTSLISAVARKQSGMYGARDPDMGFVILEEMMENGLQPNGMTYCALIDVCKRCDRSDLALKVLRMMIRQNQASKKTNSKPLENEVGAWTAAIDACGKAGRMDTAMRLFQSMLHSSNPNHVKPNMVTCGSIMDGLFKEKVLNMDNVLTVLKYMKEEGLEPTEVMYTSLISSAGRLVKAENRLDGSDGSPSLFEVEEEEDGMHAVGTKEEAIMKREGKDGDNDVIPKFIKRSGATTAVDIYTELMGTLMRTDKNVYSDSKSDPVQNSEHQNTLLLKVFLVYQEMKATGATADLALYNALLKACANAGDIARAQSVMSTIYENNLIPNDGTWREMLRAAANSQRGELVEDLWKTAWNGGGSTTDILGGSANIMDRKSSIEDGWIPSVEAFDSLLLGYLRQASIKGTDKTKIKQLHEKILFMYKRVLRLNETNEEDIEWGLHHLDLDQLHSSQRVMMTILRAAVVVELMNTAIARNSKEEIMDVNVISGERLVANRIVKLSCMEERIISNGGADAEKNAKALELARIWSESF